MLDPSLILLPNDDPVTVRGLSLSALQQDDRRRLLRLIEVVSEHGDETIIRRNTRLRVGRTTAGAKTIVVPPPMASADFLALVVFAMGGDLSGALRHEISNSANNSSDSGADEFLRILAALCVYEAERIFRQHLANAYRSVVVREHVVRGRPLWMRDFGHHSSVGISCETQHLSTDTLLNRLLFSGLTIARTILDGTPVQERAGNQVYVWRSLVGQSPVKEAMFDLAEKQISRLTEHYRLALALSRSLVTASSPSDAFGIVGSPIPHFEFSLPRLFEKVLERMLRPVAESKGIEVRAKEVDQFALIDGFGGTYREVEPDITLWKRGLPIAVIDAKFKPRYLSAEADGTIGYPNRVTNEDLYQLFFYQNRLQRKYNLAAPPFAWIVAPSLENATIPDVTFRTVHWAESHHIRDRVGLRVESLSLSLLTSSLHEGDIEKVFKAAAPDLYQHLLSLANTTEGPVANGA